MWNAKLTFKIEYRTNEKLGAVYIEISIIIIE